MIETILLAGLTLFFSALIKGISGFGTAIFAVPLLTAFFFAPSDVRVLVVTLNLILNFYILFSENRLTKANISAIKGLMIPGFIFAFLSGFILFQVNDTFFSITLGILLIITAVNKLFDFPYKVHHPKRYFLPVGSLAGVLNTLVGVGGIPVLIFMSNTAYGKNDFRKTLMLFFLAINLGSVLTFIIQGAYTVEIMQISLSMIPFVMLGSFTGMKIATHINNLRFNQLIAVLLLIMGVMSLLNI